MNRKISKFIVMVTIISLIAALFTGCGEKTQQATSSDTKDSLVVVTKADVRSFDPIFGNDTASSQVFGQIYETLLELDDNGQIVPCLAESITQPDALTYLVKLKKGIKFHNGEEMKANDVKFSIDRIASQPCDIHYLFADVDTNSFNVPDDYTISFKIKHPNAAFMAYLAFDSVAIVNEKAVKEAGDKYGMNPVGTGPYKLAKWSKGNESVLERFDDFHGTKPAIKTITMKVVPEPTNRVVELESGGADIAYDVAVTDASRVEDNPELQLQKADSTQTQFLGFNTKKKPFDDIRVRHAIRYALDTDAIVKSVYKGLCPTATNPMNPSCYFFDKSRPVSEYNVQKAKELLAEAGYPDGFKTSITVDDRKDRTDMATIIQSQLKEVGITADVKIMEWGAYLSTCYDCQQELYIGGWSTFTPEPDTSLNGTFSSATLGSGGNLAFCSNPKIDELLAAGRETMETAEREKIYLELQKEITDQCSWIYLNYGVQIVGLSKDIQGFKPNSGGYHDLSTVSFK